MRWSLKGTNFRAERFAEAATKFERAMSYIPQHPLGWKGLGHALLCSASPRGGARVRSGDRAESRERDGAVGRRTRPRRDRQQGRRAELSAAHARAPADMDHDGARTSRSSSRFCWSSSRAADASARASARYAARPYRHTAMTSAGSRSAARESPGRDSGRSSRSVCRTRSGKKPSARASSSSSRARSMRSRARRSSRTSRFTSRRPVLPRAGHDGARCRRCLEAGDLSQRLPHVYVRSPRAWSIHLPLDIGPPAITLAQVFPISEPSTSTGAARRRRSSSILSTGRSTSRTSAVR